MKRTFRQTIKRLHEPTKTVPKSYMFFLIAEAFDVFQSIFVVQIGFYIIAAIEGNNPQKIIFRGIILAVTFLIKHIVNLLMEVVYEYLQYQLDFEIKKKSLSQFIRLDNNRIDAIGTGKIQHIIDMGVSSRGNMITRTFVSICMEIGGIIYAFVLMINQSPTIYHFVGLLSLFTVSTFFMRKGLHILNNVRKESKKITMDIARQDIKIIMSKTEILQNNKITLELDKQQRLVSKNIKLRQKGNIRKGLWQTGALGLIDSLQVRIYIVVGLGVVTGNYSLAYMVLLLQLIRTIGQYVRHLRGYFGQYMDSKIHIDKLRDLFDSTPTIQGYDEGDIFMYKHGDISLKDISFQYDNINTSGIRQNNKIFSHLSLDIQGQQKTALVGESGSGKSTLIKLVAGYLHPTQGSIIVDGQNLNHTSLKSYYTYIGYLTQEPSVFDGTIRENLTYAISHQVSEESVKKAITLSKCEFIRKFSNGLDTEIGERGIKLSGGQRQRLAIAKIFLKNPKIILLDEPTSALDSVNEELIFEAMNNLFQNRTVIIIAHRLQTVKNADDIIVFKQGKIVERGTHSQLIDKGGSYAQMLTLQSGF